MLLAWLRMIRCLFGHAWYHAAHGPYDYCSRCGAYRLHERRGERASVARRERV